MNFLSLINKTSSSFYSTSSFHQKRLTLSTLSNTKTLDKEKKISLKNYHRTFLKTKLLNNERYLLTESSKNQFFLTKIFNDDLILNNDIISQRYKSLSKRSFIEINQREFKIYDNLSPRKESLSNFISKIKFRRYAKIRLKDLKRKKENILELKQTEINKLDNKLFQIQYMKSLLNKYIQQLDKYCKFLEKELNKEKHILRKIILHELTLRNLVRTLKYKIENKKAEIIKGENYRNFLLFVKYKVTQIKDLPKDIINIYHLEKYLPQEKKKKIISKNSTDLGRKSFNKKFKKKNNLIKKRTSVVIEENLSREKIKSLITKDSLKPPPLIYFSSQEYNNDIQKIKNNVINLFNYYNELMKELNVLKNERNNCLKDEKTMNNTLLYQIKKNEKKLMNIQNENIILKNDLQSINNIKFQSLFKNKILNKLIIIILKLPINIEKEFNCPNLYFTLSLKSENFLYKGKKEDTVLFCIKILEQILISKITKLNYFNINEKNKNLISEIQNRIEIEKKKHLNRVNLKNEKEKINKLREKINKKMNKVLYLPKRKVNIININSSNYRSKSEERINKNNIDYDLPFETLIY